MSFLGYSQRFRAFLELRGLTPNGTIKGEELSSEEIATRAEEYRNTVMNYIEEVRRLTGFDMDTMNALILHIDVSMIDGDNVAAVFDTLDSFAFDQKNVIIQKVCRENRTHRIVFNPRVFDVVREVEPIEGDEMIVIPPNKEIKDIIIHHSCICQALGTRCSGDRLAFLRKHFYCLRRSFVDEIADAEDTSIDEMYQLGFITLADLITTNFKFIYERQPKDVLEYIVNNPEAARGFLALRPVPPIPRDYLFLKAISQNGYVLTDEDKNFIKGYAKHHPDAERWTRDLAMEEVENEFQQELRQYGRRRVSPYRAPIGATASQRVSPVGRRAAALPVVGTGAAAAAGYRR